MDRMDSHRGSIIDLDPKHHGSERQFVPVNTFKGRRRRIMDHEPQPERRGDKFDQDLMDSYGVKLHFQLLENRSLDLKNEVDDIREFIRDNRREFNARLNKIEQLIWATLLGTLGTVGTIILNKIL